MPGDKVEESKVEEEMTEKARSGEDMPKAVVMEGQDPSVKRVITAGGDSTKEQLLGEGKTAADKIGHQNGFEKEVCQTKQTTQFPASEFMASKSSEETMAVERVDPAVSQLVVHGDVVSGQGGHG